MKKHSLSIAAFIFFAFILSTFVVQYPRSLAATLVGSGGDSNITLINPLNLGNCSTADGGCLNAFLQAVLNFVIQIGTIIVILMLVYIGFKFVVAQGEPGKISEARQMLLWTVIGALILLGAKVIATGIQATVQALSVGT